jgi:uncharacterized protein (DUF488 family)
MINILTIGFTRKSAEEFFTLLRDARAARVIDVRLNNESQLAGFAKKQDVVYFLQAVLGIGYAHLPILAPTPVLLKAYRAGSLSWPDYAKEFLALMAERQVERHLVPDLLHHGCLLCSEHEPHHCHRRLVAEYLRAKWGDVRVEHLVRISASSAVSTDPGDRPPIS